MVAVTIAVAIAASLWQPLVGGIFAAGMIVATNLGSQDRAVAA